MEVPVSNKDYLDPKENPFILAHPEDDDADDKTLMTDPDGTGMPPVFAEKNADPLRGLDAEILKDFVGSEGKRYVYPERFYAADVSKEELLTLPPRLVLTREGDHVKIEHPYDDAIMTAEEADLLRLAIEHKAKQGE